MTNKREFPILLVEDDPDDVMLLERAFRKAKIANPLHVVSDGDEAVEYLGRTGRYAERSGDRWPQLILLDLKLPRRSGHEVLSWIRWEARVTDIPVVVLTSSGQEKDITRAYELGANSYLRKPAGFDELQRMVHALDLYWLVFNQSGATLGV